MAKLIVIVGMAGSGKTRLCKALATRENAHPFTNATLVNSEDRRAGYDCLPELVGRLLRNEVCVMEDPLLTNVHFRARFQSFCSEFLPKVEQQWDFYEADPLGCINNVYYDACDAPVGERRTEPARLRTLRAEIAEYQVPNPDEYPGYTIPRPVYQQDNPHFTNLRNALDWLNAQIKLTRSQ